jgi:hypothetical protein
MYILGDVLDDYQLRNTAMEHLIGSFNCPILQRWEMITDVYERTPTGSPLRKYLVNRQIAKADRGFFAKWAAEAPVESVQEVAIALMSSTPFPKICDLTASVKKDCPPEKRAA